MKNFPVKIYFFIFLGSAFLPYLFISLILWDVNIANWNIWARIGFLLWTLVIANNVFNRFQNKE